MIKKGRMKGSVSERSNSPSAVNNMRGWEEGMKRRSEGRKLDTTKITEQTYQNRRRTGA